MCVCTNRDWPKKAKRLQLLEPKRCIQITQAQVLGGNSSKLKDHWLEVGSCWLPESNISFF